VSWVYLQYGIQVLTRQFQSSDPAGTLGAFVSIILALLMLVTSFLFQSLSRQSFFHRHVRRFLADYGMPLSLVASSAMAYWGRFNAASPLTLPVGAAFRPVGGRDWLIKFWQLDGKWVGIAFPFGVILWILFFFDHNVSVSISDPWLDSTVLMQHQSLMAQSADFPLRKPPGFHWDFFLLGVTTLIAGLLGLPAPNGLIPQAPIHTRSLLVMSSRPQKGNDEEKSISQTPVDTPSNAEKSKAGMHTLQEWPVAVVEQRISNLAQGSLCLALLTRPLLTLLSSIPRGKT